MLKRWLLENSKSLAELVETSRSVTVFADPNSSGKSVGSSKNRAFRVLLSSLTGAFLLYAAGGCDALTPMPPPTPTAMEDSCVPMGDNQADIDQALRCFPPCVKELIGSCLGTGTCVEELESSQPFYNKFRDSYANCVVREISYNRNGSNTIVSQSGTTCYSYSGPQNENLFFLDSLNRLSFSLVHSSKDNMYTVTCKDGTVFPVMVESGCAFWSLGCM